MKKHALGSRFALEIQADRSEYLLGDTEYNIGDGVALTDRALRGISCSVSTEESGECRLQRSRQDGK